MYSYMKGQSLIEVVIGLAIAVIIMTAVTTLVINSLQNAEFSKNQNLAEQYAQEGIETMRNLRDSNYSSFSSFSGTYCLNKNDPTLVSSCTTPNVDNFIRKVKIDPTGCSGITQVNVGVSWSDGKCRDVSNPYCHSVNLTTCLSNFTAAPAP